MRGNLLLRCLVAVVVTVAVGLLGSGAQAAPTPLDRPAAADVTAEGHGITAEELSALAAAGPEAFEPPPGGWPVPSDRSYYLTASCRSYAATIARGAAAWANLDETPNRGTPVECRNTYITDCGGGGRIVGCNWGRGQRIALYMGGVRDQALLAAHEFGHDWYGHSGYQCAGWTNPQHVMAPSMCGYGPAGTEHPVRID
ncbi:hypothetical protein GCM10018785_67100 [Streptomyces longispororuber]|uniref:Secreted protein n=1 Tax=Streptomyces longispororuber TaxID=68230 RepID=A0A919A742_9ACTN|nr:hypothetical protein [Streptomyces longispororuber]GHE90986.1 hypothetical protein GCM10018785_67100 [Streptomyces longispororuber]